MRLFFKMRLISDSEGGIKRAPTDELATSTNPGQPIPAPQSASAFLSSILGVREQLTLIFDNAYIRKN